MRSQTIPRLYHLLLTATVAAAWSAAPEPARAAFGDNSIGICIHVPTSDQQQMALDLGVPWLRIDLNWFAVQPTSGPPNWSAYDTVIDEMIANGFSIFATLAYTPAWASTGDLRGNGSIDDIPKGSTWPSFVQQAVARYQDRIQHWGLWNEPYGGIDVWEGTPEELITIIYQPGAAAVRAACPSCLVLGPEMNGGVDWLEKIFAADPNLFDIITTHAYREFPEMVPGVGITSDGFYNEIDSHRVLELGGLVVWEGDLSIYELMKKHGIAHKELWVTETGMQAAATDAPGVSQMKEYFRLVLEAQLQRPFWTNTFFYELFDYPGGPYTHGIAVATKGMQSVWPGDFQKKQPVYDFLQQVINTAPALGGSGTECEDLLDNDKDGTIDYPSDVDCTTPTTALEQSGAPSGDAGPGDATPGDAHSTNDAGGSSTAQDGTTEISPPSDGSTSNGGTADGSIRMGDSGSRIDPDQDSGCSCQTGGHPRSFAFSGLLFAVVLGLLRRRSRSSAR